MKRIYNGNKGLGIKEWNGVSKADKAMGERVRTHSATRKDKSICKSTKKPHNFIPDNSPFEGAGEWREGFLGGYEYRCVKCQDCGKKKYENRDLLPNKLTLK